MVVQSCAMMVSRKMLVLSGCASGIGTLVLLLLFYGGNSAGINTVGYEEILQRQREEFVNALGYEKAETVGKALKELGVNGHLKGANKIVHIKRRQKRDLHPEDTSDIYVLTNPVLITRIDAVISGTRQMHFPVDVTVTSLVIDVVTSCCQPSVSVIDPTGNVAVPGRPNVTVEINSPKHYRVRIDGPPIGSNWIVKLNSSISQTYTVNIRGRSVTNFETAFTNRMGIAVAGQPLANSTSTYLRVTPIGEPTNNWTTLEIRSSDGSLLKTLSLGQLRGRSTKAFLVKVPWPNQDVYIAIRGVDGNGSKLLRQQETIVQPIGLRVQLLQQGRDEINNCTLFRIPFTVTNAGPATNVSFNIEDDNPLFFANLSTRHLHLNTLTSINVTAALTALAAPQPGNTVYVSITVSAPDGRTQYIQETLYVGTDVDCTTVKDNGVNHRVTSLVWLLLPLVHFL